MSVNRTEQVSTATEQVSLSTDTSEDPGCFHWPLGITFNDTAMFYEREREREREREYCSENKIHKYDITSKCAPHSFRYSTLRTNVLIVAHYVCKLRSIGPLNKLALIMPVVN